MTSRNAAGRSRRRARQATAETEQPKPKPPTPMSTQQPQAQAQDSPEYVTVTKGYERLKAQGPEIFPKHLRDPKLLAEAFKGARAFDSGYEREYPETSYPPLVDYLLYLLRENVRAWAEVLLHPEKVVTMEYPQPNSQN